MSSLQSNPLANLDPLAFAKRVIERGLARTIHDAEDLCQEGALRVLAAAKRGTQIERPVSYLRRAIGSAAIDQCRRLQLLVSPMTGVDPIDTTHSSNAWDLAEEVQVTMAGLAKADQDLLRRHGMYGETFEAIARRANTSAATVCRRWGDVRHKFAAAHADHRSGRADAATIRIAVE